MANEREKFPELKNSLLASGIELSSHNEQFNAYWGVLDEYTCQSSSDVAKP